MSDNSAMLRAYLVARKRAIGQEMAELNRLLAQLDGTASQPQSARDPRPSRAVRKVPKRPAPNVER